MSVAYNSALWSIFKWDFMVHCQSNPYLHTQFVLNYQLREINPPVFKGKTLHFSVMGSHTALGYAVKLDLNPEDWQNGREEYSLPLSDR